MQDVRFILCDLKENLCKEWQTALNTMLTAEQRSHFSIIHGHFQDVREPFDCIVSPANSYARLDGAMDAIISNMFCPGNETAVTDYCQEYVYAIHNGYQVPGTALLIPMSPFADNVYKCRYILHCPTMRTPSDCRWNKEVVYNAMWNLLCELRRHNKTRKETIKKVFVTGLGTGVGRFPIETCAKQMVLAYRYFLRNLNKERTTWSEARDDGLEIEETYRTMSFLSGE